VRYARDLTDCDSAVVAWWLDGDVDAATEPPTQLNGTELDLLRSATTSHHPVFSSDDRRIAIRLFEPESFDRSRAILLMAAATRPDAQRLVNEIAEPLKLAGRHLSRALESAALKSANRRLQRSEGLQHALFAISDLAGSDRDMADVLRGIHEIVGTLMYAENFFIVLYDAEADTMRFLYYADVEDPQAPGDHSDLPMSALERSLTWYLLRDGKPLMGSTEQLRAQVSGPLAIIGPEGYDWLGVPMLRDGRAHGAVVVQSYRKDISFSTDDRNLLEFVGSHILIALERKLGKEDLEQRVRLRTLELDMANQGLQLEIIERERSVRLQAALLKIAELATADISQVEFYRRVHVVAGELINASNMFIALVTEDGQSLEFAYVIDETDEPYETRPLGRGASEYVLRNGKVILSATDMLELVDRGEMDRDAIGGLAVCWLGVPLSVGDQTLGLIVVQSYDPAVVYGPADQELLSFVASQVANSLQRRRSAENLRLANVQLEQRVQERTQDLRTEIVQRERAQEQLKHQIMHDGLTGLPNRAYLRDRLERVLQRLKREPGRRYALLFMDVDRFKLINDSLGHLAGDTVLKEVSRRLQTCIRQPDIVVRLSGDEFAILLEDIRVPETAVKVAQRVLAVMASPLQLKDGAVVEPSVSVGVAIGDANYLSADDVLRERGRAVAIRGAALAVEVDEVTVDDGAGGHPGHERSRWVRGVRAGRREVDLLVRAEGHALQLVEHEALRRRADARGTHVGRWCGEAHEPRCHRHHGCVRGRAGCHQPPEHGGDGEHRAPHPMRSSCHAIRLRIRTARNAHEWGSFCPPLVRPCRRVCLPCDAGADVTIPNPRRGPRRSVPPFGGFSRVTSITGRALGHAQ